MQYNKPYKKLALIITSILVVSFLPHTVYRTNPITSGYVAFPDGKIFYQSSGLGEPMIVLHGGPGLDQNYLLPQMLELSKNNRVILYDQRGCGKSSDFKLEAKTININSFVEDLEILRKKFGLKKFILVGHSFGGLLAMHYAIQYPEKLSALILIDTAPANPKEFQNFLAAYDKRIEPLLPKIKSIESSERFKRYAPEAITKYYRTIFSIYCHPEQMVNNLSLYFTEKSAKNSIIVEKLFDFDSLKYDLTHGLKKINTPTLIIHGEFDIIPLSTAEYIHNLLLNSTFIIIKDGDHFPYLSQPKIFFNIISTFLESNHLLRKDEDRLHLYQIINDMTEFKHKFFSKISQGKFI